jgi:hypothetical protein
MFEKIRGVGQHERLKVFIACIVVSSSDSYGRNDLPK